MATTQTVNIDINANTTDADQSVNRLENNIKTLDGAINLVGGSIAAFAGGLVASGLATEEQTKKFDDLIVPLLALGTGAKTALEGFRVLATETDLAAKAQRLYNTVLRANPIGLAVTAVAALSAAFLILRNRQKNQQEEVKTTNELYTEQLELLKNTERAITGGEARLQNIQATAVAYNRTLEEQLEIARRQAQSDIDLAETRLSNEQNALRVNDEAVEARKIALQQAKDVLNQVIAAGIIADENATKQLEADNKYKTFQEEKIDLKQKEITLDTELADSGLKLIDAKVAQAATEVQIEQVKSDKIRAINEAEQDYKDKLLTNGIDNVQGALAALFGESKAVASANVLIDAAQAGVGIIKNSQTTGPFAIAYQATQFALLAATTVASLRQINSTEPGSGGSPNTPGGVGRIPTFGVGTTTIGGGVTATSTPSFSTSAPVRAYVVTGDITNGQEAEALLNTRRQFP
tara:strand:+ start:90 stop:1484 length:1395 start_codon:yes stop_codon:yes gene_type:complete